MPSDVINIKSDKKILAVVVKAGFKQDGLKFFVPEEYTQQLGYMKYPKGHVIISHIHKPVLRKIKSVQETLFIRSGRVRIDFYDEKKHYVESRIVEKGDVVLLASGGHGFEFMEDAEMIEVKQGPFIKGISPIRFDAVNKEKINITWD